MTIQLEFMAFHANMTASIFLFYTKKMKNFFLCNSLRIKIHPAPKGIINVYWEESHKNWSIEIVYKALK